MATYYVRTDGSDTNAGTGSAANQAWQTITKAIGATGIAPGDILYIAPGVYRGAFTAGFTNPANEGQRIIIAGNPTASQFSGVTAGPVIFTNYNADNVNVTSGDLFTISKNFVTMQDIVFYSYTSTNILNGQTSALRVYRCKFAEPATNLQKGTLACTINAGSTGFIFSNNIILNCRMAISGSAHSGQWDSQSLISDNIYVNSNTNTFEGALSISSSTSGQLGGVKVVNNYLQGLYGVRIYTALSTTFPSVIQNCIIEASNVAILSDVSNTSAVIQTYNVLNSATSVTNISTSLTSKTNVYNPINGSISRIQGFLDSPFFSPLTTSQAGINAGITGNNPAADIYGTTWLAPSTPTIGAAEYQTQPVPFAYQPTERNASTITIAPGSTSQSIELYLGATGLTASTSGLSAYYNRTRSADVQITPLIARTIGQPWTSGGFAEVNASTMPGVYRLDLPDAAVAAGADDVTVVVRGASGTNGAVMTVKLSSGGLTAAQTAQAVLDAVASTHNNIGSIGAFIQDKSGYSLSTSQTFNTTGSVGSVTGNVTGNVTGTVGGVVGNVVGNLTGSVATVASPDNIIDGVWDEQRVGHTASGSFGEKLQTNAMADEMLARDLGSGQNSGAAEERTVRSALRALRNKVNVGSSQMVVKKEDDTTDAWTASVTTTAVSSNVSGIDPN